MSFRGFETYVCTAFPGGACLLSRNDGIRYRRNVWRVREKIRLCNQPHPLSVRHGHLRQTSFVDGFDCAGVSSVLYKQTSACFAEDAVWPLIAVPHAL